MGVMYYILSPFSWLLNFFYSFTDSYGISLILFALVIKIILFPLTNQGQKGYDPDEPALRQDAAAAEAVRQGPGALQYGGPAPL